MSYIEDNSKVRDRGFKTESIADTMLTFKEFVDLDLGEYEIPCPMCEGVGLVKRPSSVRVKHETIIVCPKCMGRKKFAKCEICGDTIPLNKHECPKEKCKWAKYSKIEDLLTEATLVIPEDALTDEILYFEAQDKYFNSMDDFFLYFSKLQKKCYKPKILKLTNKDTTDIDFSDTIINRMSTMRKKRNLTSKEKSALKELLSKFMNDCGIEYYEAPRIYRVVEVPWERYKGNKQT